MIASTSWVTAVALALFVPLVIGGCDMLRESATSHTPSSSFPQLHFAKLLQDTNGGPPGFICSAALVSIRSGTFNADAVLTAAHCFDDGSGHDQFSVLLDRDKPPIKLTKIFRGDRYAGKDIALALVEPSDIAKLTSAKPYPIDLSEANVSAGDEVWTWGNPDNIGTSLIRGYVMNASYEHQPVTGTIGNQEKELDFNGHYFVDMNCSSGCSGALVFHKSGAIGVVSGDFISNDGFRGYFIVPLPRLASILQNERSHTAE